MLQIDDRRRVGVSAYGSVFMSVCVSVCVCVCVCVSPGVCESKNVRADV